MDEISKEREKERKKRYNESNKGKEADKKYMTTEQGKESKANYNPELRKEAHDRYANSNKGKENAKEYNKKRRELRALTKQLIQNPELLNKLKENNNADKT